MTDRTSIEMTLENSFTEYPILLKLKDICKILDISRPTATALINNPDNNIWYTRCGKNNGYRISKPSFIDYLNKDMKNNEICKINNSVTFTNNSCDTIQMFTTGDRKEAIAND